ncbi:MAG: type II secretion system protein [Planctomycetota bacterium]
MSDKIKGVTLVELLVVISIIAFLAGALVVASQKIREQAQEHGARALIEKLISANEQFFNEWRQYAPDSPEGLRAVTDGRVTQFETSPAIPTEIETREIDVAAPGMPADKMPTTCSEYLMISLQFWGQFLKLSKENIAGPERKIDLGTLGSKGMETVNSKCIIVDNWGRPIFYDCHKPEGKRYTPGIVAHNINAFDIFSLGADGRTSSTSNKIDDDGDGTVDESDEADKLGESVDDLNNWRGMDRR